MNSLTTVYDGDGKLGMERLPPQAVDVEQAVIGAMMIGRRAIDDARDILSADDFYHLPHRIMWEALTHLADSNAPTDQVSVVEELKRLGKLDTVGGIVYVAKLASEVATTANVRHHARIVREKSKLRHMIEVAHRIEHRSYQQADEADTIITDLEVSLAEIQGCESAETLTAYSELLAHTLERLEALSVADGKLLGIPSGFPALDRMTAGFQRGELILVAARPKMGKSSLALTFANAAAMENHGVAIFSLEMSKSQLMQRNIAMEASVDALKIKTGQLNEDEWVQISNVVNSLAERSIYVNDQPGLNVVQIGAVCRQLKREGRLGMVIVDYLQLMSCHVRTGSREQEVSKISQGLKNLARDLDVPVIALSQLSRKLEDRPGQQKRPKPSDLRDSGSLEQDCDICLFVYRPEEYGLEKMTIHTHDDKYDIDAAGMAEIIVSLNRSGPTGTVYARWFRRFTRFDPYRVETQREEPDYGPHHNNE